MLILLALLACTDKADDTADAWVPPGCGDGVLDADEACDDGSANSDTEPDACRSDCREARCGDGVADSAEACDDGGPWGGDGCTPTCAVEDGQLDEEPNDPWDAATAWTGEIIYGGLPEGDEDCWAVDLADCQALGGTMLGPCPDPATLRLHGPDGSEVAVGSPGSDGCATLDPAQAEGARFLTQGTWTLCVSGLLGAEVPAYALELSPVAAEDATYDVPEGDDPDGDGLPDRCDDDRDGDGIDDIDDDCPDIPDGPDADPLAPDTDGFLRQWLAAGPYTGTDSAESCLPSEDMLVADDDALVRPAIGDPAGEHQWRVLWGTGSRVELLTDFATVDPAREVYLATYVYTEGDRALTLAVGPDDGARVWLGGDRVLDIDGCQAATVDQYQADVTLTAGWTPLVLKIRDQGGDWATYVRFLDDGLPVTDLELSLSPDGAWESQQSDLDGDGSGDVCDDTPAG